MKQVSFILLMLCCFTAKSQSDAAAAGGDAKGTGGSAAFSIGIANYTSQTSATGFISQGVQQPYFIIASNIKTIKTNLLFSVFPNPTKKEISLKFLNALPSNSHYVLHDILGKTILSGNIAQLNTILDLSSVINGIYIVSVFSDEQLINSTKIIKID